MWVFNPLNTSLSAVQTLPTKIVKADNSENDTREDGQISFPLLYPSIFATVVNFYWVKRPDPGRNVLGAKRQRNETIYMSRHMEPKNIGHIGIQKLQTTTR